MQEMYSAPLSAPAAPLPSGRYKDLHDPDNHDGVITGLEPNILKCEVKWALGSITMNKASGGDGIPVELFQIRKDDAVKVLHSICHQIWKTQQWPQDWKRSVFTPIPKKGNAKECPNYHTIALISHASKFRKLSSGHRTLKRSVFIPIPKKAIPKNVQTTAQLHSFHVLAR